MDIIDKLKIDCSNFKFVRNLGSGSNGTVIQMKDEKNQNYAVKLYEEFNENCVNDMLKEAEAMFVLHHPSILQIVGIQLPSRHEGRAMLVIELAPNGNLKLAMEKNEIDKIGILWEIAKGMAYMHSKGVIHRDIKPENILLDKHFHAKICDFGLARNEDVTMTENRGTPMYIAPEMIRGNEYDSKVDVFSFGQMALEMFLEPGEQLFSDLNRQVIFKNILENKLIDVPSYIDQPLHDIIKCCRSYNPSERPDFNEIETALRPFVKPSKVKRVLKGELMNMNLSSDDLRKLVQQKKQELDKLKQELSNIERQSSSRNSLVRENVPSEKEIKEATLEFQQLERKRNDLKSKLQKMKQEDRTPFADIKHVTDSYLLPPVSDHRRMSSPVTEFDISDFIPKLVSDHSRKPLTRNEIEELKLKLFKAARTGDLETINDVLDKGIDVNSLNFVLFDEVTTCSKSFLQNVFLLFMYKTLLFI